VGPWPDAGVAAVTHDSLLRSLGVPDDYGLNPPLPRYREARRLKQIEPNILGRPQSLAPATAAAWTAMREAAQSAGIEIMIVSGFRSIEDQAELFRRKLAAGQAMETILRVNAAPGFSQHHTGRAVDIAAPGCRPLIEEFAATPAFDWLRANAQRFGFRMPYGKQNRFGFTYEPWHWCQLPA
jgi:D-alanyl-D-alanine carboxypeptidase